MITKPDWTAGGAVIDHSNMAGADESSAAVEKGRSAAIGEMGTVTIQIRAGDGFSAPDPDLIGAVRALATFAPIHEEIIIAPMACQAGGLDGLVPGDPVERGIRAETSTGLRIEFRQENPLPK